MLQGPQLRVCSQCCFCPVWASGGLCHGLIPALTTSQSYTHYKVLMDVDARDQHSPGYSRAAIKLFLWQWTLPYSTSRLNLPGPHIHIWAHSKSPCVTHWDSVFPHLYPLQALCKDSLLQFPFGQCPGLGESSAEWFCAGRSPWLSSPPWEPATGLSFPGKSLVSEVPFPLGSFSIGENCIGKNI